MPSFNQYNSSVMYIESFQSLKKIDEYQFFYKQLYLIFYLKKKIGSMASVIVKIVI